MGTPLPVFPLGTVVYPGVTLDLHVFEQRYLDLVASLRDLPAAQRVFGVVAIKEGYEVGDSGVTAAHRVGCEVLVTAIDDSGPTVDLETRGIRRFRVESLDDSRSYLVADVEYLDESDGRDVEDAATRAHAVFEAYRGLLVSIGAGELVDDDLPTAPAPLSYALAAATLLTVRDRQGLLEAPDSSTRLRQYARLLVDEITAIRAIPSLPAVDVAQSAWSPN